LITSSSNEDYDDDGREVSRRRHLRDDPKDFKVKALEFDRNLNLEAT